MGEKQYSMAGLNFEASGKFEYVIEAYKHGQHIDKILLALKKLNLTGENFDKKVDEILSYFTEKFAY